MSDRPAFTSDLIWRLCALAARYWIIEHFTRTQQLPEKRAVLWAYADRGIDWGQDLLKGKRVKITIEIEDR